MSEPNKLDFKTMLHLKLFLAACVPHCCVFVERDQLIKDQIEFKRSRDKKNFRIYFTVDTASSAEKSSLAK